MILTHNWFIIKNNFIIIIIFLMGSGASLE